MIKVFFGWLLTQLIFARVLFLGAIEIWRELKIPPDYVGYFVIPTTIVIVGECLVSGVVVYGVLESMWKSHR
jgi:hypothetical protein